MQISFWQNTIDIIYSIHMPIFTLISGFIYMFIRNLDKTGGGYSSVLGFIKKKTFRIVIPFIVWGFIECTIDMGCRYKYMLVGPLHIWYLRFILESFILTRLIDKYLLKYPFLLVILILIQYVVFDVVGYHTIDIPFDINYRYFLLGMSCYWLIERVNLNKVIVSIATLLLFGLFLFYRNIFPHYIIVAVVMCLNCSILLFFSTIRFKNDLPAWVINLDRCSMGIYLIHHPIIWNVAKNSVTRAYMGEYYVIGPILLSVLSFIASWAVTNLILKNKKLRYILG